MGTVCLCPLWRTFSVALQGCAIWAWSCPVMWKPQCCLHRVSCPALCWAHGHTKSQRQLKMILFSVDYCLQCGSRHVYNMNSRLCVYRTPAYLGAKINSFLLSHWDESQGLGVRSGGTEQEVSATPWCQGKKKGDTERRIHIEWWDFVHMCHTQWEYESELLEVDSHRSGSWGCHSRMVLVKSWSDPESGSHPLCPP